uniref:Transposase of ISCARN94, IS1595 family IS1595 group n=1 Tax=mine drainage metagenome TaxID=410659 RepID=E6QQB5_9ZZZZ
MAMNKVQFQRGLPMAEFQKRYGTEAKCHATLAVARWPKGFVCSRCGGTKCSTHEREGRPIWQCSGCRYQTTVTAGTIFEATKLPLTLWFLAMHLLTQAKNAVSALELKRHLGVSYPTAWLMKHKLMQVMAIREENRVLDGRVEIDDAYLGGERTGKRGRGSVNKVLFVVAVQTTPNGKPVMACFAPIPFSSEAIADWAKKSLASSACIYSDSLQGFRSVVAGGATHERIPMTGLTGRQAAQHPQFRAMNTVLGNLKTAFSGTYHAFNFQKYALRYLAEMQYRFNRRFDLSTILIRLVHAALTTTPYPAQAIKLAEVC